MPMVRVRRRSRLRRFGPPAVIALLVLMLLYVVSAATGLHRVVNRVLTVGEVAALQIGAPTSSPAGPITGN